MKNKSILEKLFLLKEAEFLSDADYYLAKFINTEYPEATEEEICALAFTNKALLMGHLCLNLKNPQNIILNSYNQSIEKVMDWKDIQIKKPSEWYDKLMHSVLCSQEEDKTSKPLVMDLQGNVYLRRYYTYQSQLVQLILKKSKVKKQANEKDVQPIISRLFPLTDELDYQLIAAYSAAVNSFSVITGGPGTGKTATVVRILALLQELKFLQSNQYLKIMLTAPTGKAAMRLAESIIQQKQATERPLFCSQQIKDHIPEEAATIHRLLKYNPYWEKRFQFDQSNPLDCDVLVVDETSMADIGLITQLLSAVPEHCQIILLGDKNQLTSIEAGSVFGDICVPELLNQFSADFAEQINQLYQKRLISNSQSDHYLQNIIIQLQKSYRYQSGTAIYELAKGIQQKEYLTEIRQRINGLSQQDEGSVYFYSCENLDHLKKIILKQFIGFYEELMLAHDPYTFFKLFSRFIVLCAYRKGIFGSDNLNRFIEKILQEKRLIKQYSQWYPGRPVMITANNYQLGLFNGDIGITLFDPETKQLAVYFQDAQGNIKKFFPSRLPSAESVYAMTIHKSQGSEFDEVFLYYGDQVTSILTREILYTGITRAKKKVHISISEEVFNYAVSHAVDRVSGIKDKLI
ncbi:MAG: exodeoxyribonuclease V subunit alpha [Spirochaetes bacterium]|nr:exodeoxyribonuclease V subunit alpha [Spirochaetota bacterium]